MFQILSMTQAKLVTLTPRSEKHGDDEKPAVSLGIEIEAANTILDSIDPTLRGALFKAVEGQEDLPGVEKATPVLRCNSIDRVFLPTKHEGWTLAVDDGLDETKPMAFGGVKVDKFSVEPKQGGSIVLRLRLGTSDLDAARSGMLGMHVGQAIWVTLTAPKVPAEEPKGKAKPDDDRQGKLDDGKPPKGSKGAAKTPEQALADTEGPGNRKGKKRETAGAGA